MLTSFVIPMLQLAALYSLIGLAWVAIFQATGVFNLATGSFIVLGPYFVIGLSDNDRLGLALALPVGLLLTVLLAVVGYQLMLRPLAGRPILAPIIVTLGASILFNAVVQIIWGAEARPIEDPLAGSALQLSGDRQVPATTLIGIGAAFAFTLGIIVLMRFTRLGIRMRAAAENPLRAGQLGIGVHRMAMIGWGIAAFAAAGAGALYSIQNLASPELATLGFKGLAPAMLGGFQSAGGTALGAVLVALLETVAVEIWGGAVREVVPFVVLLVLLLIRPSGLFGKPTYLRV